MAKKYRINKKRLPKSCSECHIFVHCEHKLNTPNGVRNENCHLSLEEVILKSGRTTQRLVSSYSDYKLL